MVAGASAALEVFWSFLRLGMRAFGGPIAHLGYFRAEFVERRGWLDDAELAEFIALCSALPGPTSSQVGILIGTRHAGALGGLGAWLGFTTPSAIIMATLGILLRSGGPHQAVLPFVTGAFGGLIAAAGGVVAQAVVALARSLATTRCTQIIALGGFAVALYASRVAPQLQWIVLVAGALAGGFMLEARRPLPQAAPGLHIPRSVAFAATLLLLGLLIALPAVAAPGSAAALFALFVRAGSLVFGGGHVVLPFLQALIASNLVPASTFFAGYGAAQALPGPLFTFASFLGAVNASPTHGIPGALLATAGIFLPSFLLIAGVLPIWNAVRALPRAAGVLAGVNAAVVGLLGAVLVTPIGTTLLSVPWQLALAVCAFVALVLLRAAPWAVVACCAAIGAAAGSLAPNLTR